MHANLLFFKEIISKFRDTCKNFVFLHVKLFLTENGTAFEMIRNAFCIEIPGVQIFS